jgi:Bardet-Biedl syndrome 1 protein
LFTRVRVARAYAKMLDSSHAPVSLNSDEMMKVSVAVHGFGPHFLMVVYLRTMSVQVCRETRSVCEPRAQAITGVYLLFDYNTRLYQVEKNMIECALLVPGIEYTFETKVTCMQPDTGASAHMRAHAHFSGMSDDVRCMVMKDDRAVPCITAQVAMPVSEQSLID